jgi:uncharacterized glyoxalase superfamily protein PhnB
MKITAHFPITITEKLTECKEFYIEYFDFSVVFEADWYIHLVHPSGVQVAVMKPNVSNQPAFLHTQYSGEGIVYSFEVADATAEFERLKQTDIKIFLPLKDEEWGQRHFIVQDPAGVHVDVVEHLNPTA